MPYMLGKIRSLQFYFISESFDVIHADDISHSPKE